VWVMVFWILWLMGVVDFYFWLMMVGEGVVWGCGSVGFM
jgi:hypothetical protein